ncbi:MAG: hypothetical protein M0035_17945 [Actinomycetota bacterium]|jgi:hypothetical protein|nr:hypothetical protein [Actinomycetota bacterium]
MPAACWQRNWRLLAELRRGAGSMPWAFSTQAIALAVTRCPWLSSWPRIRWDPHAGLSVGIATISVTGSSPMGGAQAGGKGTSSSG